MVKFTSIYIYYTVDNVYEDVMSHRIKPTFTEGYNFQISTHACKGIGIYIAHSCALILAASISQIKNKKHCNPKCMNYNSSVYKNKEGKLITYFESVEANQILF